MLCLLSFLREGRVVGPCWEKLKPKGPKGTLFSKAPIAPIEGRGRGIHLAKCFIRSPFYGRACRWACWEKLKPKGPKGLCPRMARRYRVSALEDNQKLSTVAELSDVRVQKGSFWPIFFVLISGFTRGPSLQLPAKWPRTGKKTSWG